MMRWWWLMWALGMLQAGHGLAQAPALVRHEDRGLSVAPGFRITLFADNHLAQDIHSLTLNSQGQVVVSGPGYIKILHDADANGVADKATLFATPKSGAMGLCFDGTALFANADGWFCRYRDQDADGRADAPPDRLFPLQAGEHGGHAIRKGPDGWYYVIGSNDAGITRDRATLDSSPIRQVEAGALLRISPDGQQTEIIAHGFRNPCGFDFNWLGELFTCDSDTERDYLLPWYAPARFYHIGHAGHHGWRLTGNQRGWARPGYYADTVPTLYDVGQSLPAGIVHYRHRQFPEHYQDGFFTLDWAYGRVFFVPLALAGASYQGAPELFLESIGTHGFTPTDAVVAPDGALLIATGGRKTRGGIYRIQYVGVDATDRAIWDEWTSATPMERVLQAPQPLDAWSRAIWEPLALRLGEDAFGRIAVDEQRAPEDRVRAIEIITGIFAGLSVREATAAGRAGAPEVRARVAWSLNCKPCLDFTPLVLGLATDPHPLVRRCALETLADRYLDLERPNLSPVLEANLAHPDKRVRLAAARLAAMLPIADWEQLKKIWASAAAPMRLTAALAAAWREPDKEFKSDTLEMALGAWKSTVDSNLRLDAARLMLLALGDYHLNRPSLEAYTGFELNISLKGREKVAERIRQVLRPAFPSANVLLNVETTRLLAILGDGDPNLLRRVAAQITPQTTATLDFHYLTVLSCLPGVRPAEVTTRTANALVGLDRKLANQPPRLKQNWNVRLTEIASQLLKRDPGLGEILLRHPDFAREGNVPLAGALNRNQQPRAAALFLRAVHRDPNFNWSRPLIDLLGQLPPEQTQEVWRRQWSNWAWRDELTVKLARRPDPLDHPKFVAGLDSLQFEVADVCLAALLTLPPDDSPQNLLPLMRLLGRLAGDPKYQGLRRQAILLLNKQTGQNFAIKEANADASKLPALYQPVYDWFAAVHPQLARQLMAETGDDSLARLLKMTAWNKGIAARGETQFNQRGCVACHGGTSPLGPDLTGVTSRLTPLELFRKIAYPSRKISEAYRPANFRLKNGQTITGLVIFESADVYLVQTGPAATMRLSADAMAAVHPGKVSLMPPNLLQGLQPSDLADLYACLKKFP